MNTIIYPSSAFKTKNLAAVFIIYAVKAEDFVAGKKLQVPRKVRLYRSRIGRARMETRPSKGTHAMRACRVT